MKSETSFTLASLSLILFFVLVRFDEAVTRGPGSSRGLFIFACNNYQNGCIMHTEARTHAPTEKATGWEPTSLNIKKKKERKIRMALPSY